MEKFVSFFIPNFIWKKIEANAELKKILVSVNWLFFDNAVQMTISLLVGVWVIRYLGPEKYGILSYAIAFIVLFSVIAKLGLDNVTVREFVKNPEKKDKIFGSIFLIKIIGGILASVFSIIVIFFVRPGDDQVFILTLIISLGFIFQSSDVIDFWFRSKVNSKYIAYTKSATTIISGIIKITLILIGAPLVFFAWVIFFESVINSIGRFYFFSRNNESLKKWKIDTKIIKDVLRDSWPLTLSSVAVLIYMKIDQIMIGNMLGDKELGYYSAAVVLSEAWYFIPLIISDSVFPAIIYSKKNDESLYLKRLQVFYDILVWSSVLISILVTFFARDIIGLLYGQDYSQSVGVLVVYMWASVFVFLSLASGKFLLAENLTKLSFLRTSIGCVSNIALNIYLIPRFGIVGAAWATLISYSLVVFAVCFEKRARINFKMYVRTLNLVRIYKYSLNIIKK